LIKTLLTVLCAFAPSLRRTKPFHIPIKCYVFGAALALASASLQCLSSFVHAQPVAKSVTPVHPVTGLQRAGGNLSQLKIESWVTEQGLPINTVQSMYQARDGALWIGTASGLARFDGTRFSTFEDASIPELSSRAAFGFMEDSGGTLWIAYSSGVARYRAGKFTLAIDRTTLQSRRAWAFAQASDGATWIATESGLIRWARGPSDSDAGSITHHLRVADGLPTDRLRALAFDRDGTLWIATTGGGLVSYANNKFNTMNPANGFPHLEVRHVMADPAGGVWAATAGAGLVRVNGSEIKTYTVADGLPTNQLTYLARRSATRAGECDEIWIGTWGSGVVRLCDGKFVTMSSAQGLGGDQVWALHVDREGSLWTGTWNGGLNRLSRRAFGVIGKPEGLSNDNARAIIHDRNGATWVATAGGGVNLIEGGAVRAFTKRDGLATDESSGLLEDRDGAIWVASYTAGVTRIRPVVTSDPAKDIKKYVIDNFGVADGLQDVDVRALLQDKAGTIWAGTVTGLARFDGKRFIAVTGAGTEPLSEGIIAMRQDRSGALWFGTAGKGLVRYSDGAWKTYTRKEGLVSNWVLALHEDASGAMWVGTNGEGMNRIKEGRVSPIRASDGLWDNTVQVILEDKKGNLWMTCNRGFFYVPRRELEDFVEGRVAKISSTPYGPTDALRSTTFASGQHPAGSIDANGHLWLPSLKGVVLVDPQALPGDGTPPSVSVHDVLVDGKSQFTDDAIVLPPGSLPLSIRFTAGTLIHADRARFRYRMDGLTRDWVDAGKNREATFPSLPYGSYRFIVATSIDGKRWQESAQPLTVQVKPRFYQTPWFAALGIMAAIGTVFGLVQLRTQQLQRRDREMTRIVAERTEELRLANEHLARLSLLDPLTSLANRRHMDAMLDIEWRRAMRSQTPLAVIIVDVDAFKAYNDTLGHPEGDKCLVALANVIRDATHRAGDMAARYGGEEFIILISGLAHADALKYAEKLRHDVEARAIPHPSSPVGPTLTISLGVATCIPSAVSSPTALIAQADAALYRAKNEGRNRVR
jgi:diguanylate cyclase (GGDEF)-like protein